MHPSAGERLSALRRERGLTQQEVAERLASAADGMAYHRGGPEPHLGVNAQMVSKWERGLKKPSPVYRKLYCSVFGVDYFELWSESQPEAERSTSTNRRTFGRFAISGIIPVGMLGEEAPGRVLEETGRSVSPEYNESVRIFLAGIDAEFEHVDPRIFAPTLNAQRHLAASQLERSATPIERAELLENLGYIDSMIANVALNKGEYSRAQAKGWAAFGMAGAIDSADLANWALVNICNLYQMTGHYRAMRDVACLAVGSNSALNARLACCEARAWARLGELRQAERALGNSYKVMDGLPKAAQGEPGFSRTTWSRSDLDAGAADVYSILQKPKQSLAFADVARASVDATGKPGLQAYIRLSMASAQLAQKNLDGAIALIADACYVAGSRRPHNFYWMLQELRLSAAKIAGRGQLEELDQELAS